MKQRVRIGARHVQRLKCASVSRERLVIHGVNEYMRSGFSVPLFHRSRALLPLVHTRWRHQSHVGEFFSSAVASDDADFDSFWQNWPNIWLRTSYKRQITVKRHLCAKLQREQVREKKTTAACRFHMRTADPRHFAALTRLLHTSNHKSTRSKTRFSNSSHEEAVRIGRSNKESALLQTSTRPFARSVWTIARNGPRGG